jgi:prepilin-type N-terminal cleavage/methylation domain-containing protein
MRTHTNRGFTLIELLVVIAIIGILSSVVLASLNSARKKGRDARRISDVKQLQLALELFYDNNSSEYPNALSQLAPTYISVVPQDPQGTNYSYDNLTSGNATCDTSGAPPCTSYVLGATLEDTANPVLNQDIDGTVGSVTCTDSGTEAVFCVQP